MKYMAYSMILAAGNAKPECSGTVTAIAQQAAKLESTYSPVILLESDNR